MRLSAGFLEGAEGGEAEGTVIVRGEDEDAEVLVEHGAKAD